MKADDQARHPAVGPLPADQDFQRIRVQDQKIQRDDGDQDVLAQVLENGVLIGFRRVQGIVCRVIMQKKHGIENPRQHDEKPGVVLTGYVQIE